MAFAIRPQNLFTKFYYYVIWNVNYYVTYEQNTYE